MKGSMNNKEENDVIHCQGVLWFPPPQQLHMFKEERSPLDLIATSDSERSEVNMKSRRNQSKNYSMFLLFSFPFP